jgi:hypothetical protein
MKKILTLTLLAISTGAFSQTMYKMESIPIYDSLGNQYQMRETFDHLPTSQDTIEFNKATISYCKQIDRALKLRAGARQYQAVVAEVKISKNSHVAIKPTSKFKSPWYRYYDVNVKVGDTIWISREDAIEPRF